MPTSEELTDSYLAALLAREASEPAGRRMNRPKDAPKPNLTFLRNIIRDTDSHNAVLLEREKQSTARGRRDAQASEREANDRSAKRRRTERPDRWSTALAQQGLRRHDRECEHDTTKSRRSDDRARNHDHNSRHKDKHRERRHKRSRSPASANSRHDRHRRHRSASPVDVKIHRARRRSETPADMADSDPFEDLIGPRPLSKAKPRGRGSTAATSGIDSRFADAHYDPSKDTQHDEDDDWDMALSALQDRAKWRAIGADRLRAAGFDEADIAKWEGNLVPAKPNEDIDSVVWSKRGEARDWDRGKVVQSDGTTTTKAVWSD